GGADDDLAALAAWAFQGRDTAWLATRLGLAGGKAVDAWRREQVARRLAGPTLSSGRGEG
ncbi:hypothetical protein, partial [Halomonas smyrnensis]|uniref:hypothetical protein n=1 Tax=Halomonas smyrnensis TaxID=720605 RepID=UPI0004746A31